VSTTDSGVGFLPTHRVPAAGLATYPEPTPAAPSGPRLEPALDVQVVEQRDDGWAKIACANGWTAWGDGRLLAPLPRYVPASGIVTFAAADPRQAPGARLDAGLEVAVSQQRPDGWAHVVCSNGWSAWADGRLLLSMPLAGTPAVHVQAPPISSRPGAPAYARSRPGPYTGPGYAGSVPDEVYTRWLPLLGGVLVVVGSFLPWVNVLSVGVSPWHISFLFLFRVTTDAFPHIGVVTLASAVLIFGYALAPFVLGRPAPRRVLFIGAVIAVDTALLYFGRWLHPATGIGLAVGPFVTLAGGGLAAVAHFRSRPVGARGLGWI